MKKITSVLIAVLLLLSINVAAVATDIKTTDVIMVVDPSMETYTLTIPATVIIDPAVRVGTLDVTLSDVNLVWNNWLRVDLTTKNRVDGEMGSYLVNEEDATQKVSYTLHSNATNGDYWGGAPVDVAYYSKFYNSSIEAYSEHYEVGPIVMTVTGEYPGAGTYRDTLTFSVVMGLNVMNLDPNHPSYPYNQ